MSQSSNTSALSAIIAGLAGIGLLGIVCVAFGIVDLRYATASPDPEAPILAELPASVVHGVRQQIREQLVLTPSTTAFNVDECEECHGSGWRVFASAAAAPEAAPLPEPPVDPPPTGRSVWIPGSYETGTWVDGHWEEPPLDPPPASDLSAYDLDWEQSYRDWKRSFYGHDARRLVGRPQSRIVPITPPDPSLIEEYEEVPVTLQQFDVRSGTVWTKRGTELSLDVTLRVPDEEVADVLMYLQAISTAVEKLGGGELVIGVPKGALDGPEPIDEPEPIGDRTPPEPDTDDEFEDDEEEETLIPHDHVIPVMRQA